MTGVVGEMHDDLVTFPLNEDDLGNPPRVDINLGNMDVFVYADEDEEEEEDPDEPASAESLKEDKGPVRMTLDLDDGEVAEKEGIASTWEEYESFHLFFAEQGMAVLVEEQNQHSGACYVLGLVRYKDRTSIRIRGDNLREAKTNAEKFLAKRPYKTAFDRILEGPSYDAPDPPLPVQAKPEPAVAVVRPPTPKRVWKNVPITDGEDD